MRTRYSTPLFTIALLLANLTGWIYTLMANATLSLADMSHFGFYTNLITLVSIVTVAFGVSVNRFDALGLQVKLTKHILLGFLVGLSMTTLFVVTSSFWSTQFKFPVLEIDLWMVGMIFLFMMVLAWLRGVFQARMWLLLTALGLFVESVVKVSFGVIGLKYDLALNWFLLAMPAGALAAIVWHLLASKLKGMQFVLTHALPTEETYFWLQAIIQRAGVTLLITLDVILAKMYLSEREAGIYVLVSLFGKMIFFISQSLYMVVTPLVRSFMEDHRRRRKSLILLLVSLLLPSILMLGLFLSLPELTLYPLFGARYMDIYQYILPYSIAALLLSLIMLLTLYDLLVKRYIMSWLVLAASILEFLLFWIRHDSVAVLVDNVFISAAVIFTLYVFFGGYSRYQLRKQA